MAIEHSCRECGRGLGRIRALPDPIYGLPIVICPGCGVACVRRKHPLSVAWRKFVRWSGAIWAMGWRLGVCFLLLALTFVVVGMNNSSLQGLTPVELVRHAAGWEPLPDAVEAWQNDSGPLLMGVGVGWFIGLGAAATAGLGHVRRRWIVWAVLAGSIFAVFTLYAGVNAVDNASRVSEPSASWNEFAAQWRAIRPAAMLAACGLLLAPIGMSIGRSLRRALARREKHRWMSKLARAKKRRLAI